MEKSEREFEKYRSYAMIFGGIVYVGVVMAASTLFISFVLEAFPQDAYLSRSIMTLSGLMIGASMLAFPVALHFWAVSGVHRTVTTILYYIEMMIIAVNTVVSFSSLLSIYKGTPMPNWAAFYEPFAVASIVYTLGAWGTVFLLDPRAKREAQKRAFKEEYENMISATSMEFLGSDQGRAAVAQASIQDIELVLEKKRGVNNFPMPVKAMEVPAQNINPTKGGTV